MWDVIYPPQVALWEGVLPEFLRPLFMYLIRILVNWGRYFTQFEPPANSCKTAKALTVCLTHLSGWGWSTILCLQFATQMWLEDLPSPSMASIWMIAYKINQKCSTNCMNQPSKLSCCAKDRMHIDMLSEQNMHESRSNLHSQDGGALQAFRWGTVNDSKSKLLACSGRTQETESSTGINVPGSAFSYHLHFGPQVGQHCKILQLCLGQHLPLQAQEAIRLKDKESWTANKHHKTGCIGPKLT